MNEWASQVMLAVKKPPASADVRDVRSLGWEDPLEEEMATHSCILAGRIPWIINKLLLQCLLFVVSDGYYK